MKYPTIIILDSYTNESNSKATDIFFSNNKMDFDTDKENNEYGNDNFNY